MHMCKKYPLRQFHQSSRVQSHVSEQDLMNGALSFQSDQGNLTSHTELKSTSNVDMNVTSKSTSTSKTTSTSKSTESESSSIKDQSSTSSIWYMHHMKSGVLSDLFHAGIAAWATYSTIPMPRCILSQRAISWMMGWFWTIGLCQGALLAGVICLSRLIHVHLLIQVIICLLIPFLLTGGIHLDGFSDVMDASCSRQDRDRQLAIMKDPHIGAFGVIGLVMLIVTQSFLWLLFIQTFDHNRLISLFMIPILSRLLSGVSVILFPKAKSSGMLYAVSRHTPRKLGYGLLCLTACLGILWMVIQPLLGSLTMLVILLVFGYYAYFSHRRYGGTTGDLAGWFLCLVEWFALLMQVI